MTPTYTTFGGGGSATVPALIAVIKLRPFIGKYLFFRFQAQRGNGNTTADVIFSIRIPYSSDVEEITRVTVAAASWSKFVAFSPDLTARPLTFGPLDLSGADLDIEVSIFATPNQGEIRGLYVAGCSTNVITEQWQT